MVRERKKSRSAGRSKAQTEWLGAFVPAGIDCKLVAWVDRKTGELLEAALCRSRVAEAELEASARRLLERRGKPVGRLCVPEAGAAQLLRRAIEGVPVGASFDAKADDVWLAAAKSAPCLRGGGVVTLAGGEPTVTLQVTLANVEPPVWRRVRVAADVSLAVLHLVLQEAMGWEDCHVHHFEVGGHLYGFAGEDAPPDERDEQAYQIGDLLKKGSCATYLYDFGDDWLHDLAVVEVDSAVAGDPTAACVDGAGACPPEDSGGPPGYADKLGALTHPKSPEDRELAEWMGESFDPASFDVAVADARVRGLFHVTSAALEGDLDEGDLDDALLHDASLHEEGLFDDDLECAYDAAVGPEPDAWLALDEQEQIFHAGLYHTRQAEPVPAAGAALHASLHAVVESQIAAKDPPMVRKTVTRLVDEGVDRHDAIHVIAAVFTAQLHRLVQDGRGEPSGFDELGYVRELRRLKARDWLGS